MDDGVFGWLEARPSATTKPPALVARVVVDVVLLAVVLLPVPTDVREDIFSDGTVHKRPPVVAAGLAEYVMVIVAVVAVSASDRRTPVQIAS